MSVGLTKNKADIDNRLAAVTLELRTAFDHIETLKTVLDTMTDGDLLALTGSPSYTAGEVAILRSAMTDLDQLRAVYKGLATRTPAYDYRTFAKLLTGVV